MSWNASVYEQFQNIADLVGRPDCTIQLLSRASNVREAFRKQNLQLITYLINNLGDIIDISVGNKVCDDEITQKLCLYFLSSSSPSFSGQLHSNPIFLEKINNMFVDISKISESALASLCRILEFAVDFSEGFIFKYLGHSNNIFAALVKRISSQSAACLLHHITDSGHQNCLDFLENSDATEVLFNALSDDAKINERIISIITNIVCSVIPTSKLVHYLLDGEKLDEIFQMCMSGSSRLSAMCFNLLLELCSICDDAAIENSESVFGFVSEKINVICEFIGNDDPFSAAKSRACDLLIGVVSSFETIPECVFSLLEKMFERVFINPIHSILHCAFLTLFVAIHDMDPDIIRRIDPRAKIIDAFAQKDSITALYWGHLYKLAEIVQDSDLGDIDGWNDFISGPFEQMSTVINREYGGHRPNNRSESYDSDSFEYRPRKDASESVSVSWGFGSDEEEYVYDEEEDLDAQMILIDNS